MTGNLDLLEVIAREIRPLLDELVFVGGAIAELYATVPTVPRVRATRDADALCECASYGEYAALGQRLQACGFAQSVRHTDPIYRWRSKVGILDLMPMDEHVLGYTNRWYAYGFATAVRREIARGLRIRILSPPAYLATKLAAYEGRGKDDPHSSHDLEDIVALLARRPEIVEEIRAADGELAAWVAGRFRELLARDDADELVAANLAGPLAAQLRPIVLQRMTALAG